MSSTKLTENSSVTEEVSPFLSAVIIKTRENEICECEDEKNRTEGNNKHNAYIDNLGVSVHYLQTQFMEEIHQVGLKKTSKTYQIENLKNEEPGVIRTEGLNTFSPTDGKIGATYTHFLEGDDHVGVADLC